ncbi:hypothetical protein L195_g056414, partial [Trifolium pratense]
AAAAEGDGKSSDAAEETKVVEFKRNEYHYYNPPSMEFYYNPSQAYPPQMFSDENPNACSVM